MKCLNKASKETCLVYDAFVILSKIPNSKMSIRTLSKLPLRGDPFLMTVALYLVKKAWARNTACMHEVIELYK